MFIDKSLARGLAKSSLQTYVDLAKQTRLRFESFGREAIAEEASGRPYAKVASALVKKLEAFFKEPGVLGHIDKFAARKSEFILYLPTWSGEDLHFSIAMGSIDGRKPLAEADIFPLLTVSKHALARLHQRLGTMDSQPVLLELLTALTPAVKMRIAANAAAVPYWPLISSQGIFVTAPAGPTSGNVLVTWLPRDGLSAKWQRLVNELEAVEGYRSLWLTGQDGCADVLRRNTWLSDPREPRPDPAAQWWGQA